MFQRKGFNSCRFCRQGHRDPVSGGFGVALDIWGDDKDMWVAIINNYGGFYSYHTENVDFYFFLHRQALLSTQIDIDEAEGYPEQLKINPELSNLSCPG